MSVSETEKSLRRRILFNSLPAGTSEDIIQRAIDLLDNEFGSQPELQFVQLVKRLRESVSQDVFGARNLLGKMVMLRAKPADQIGPDPAKAISSGGAMMAPGNLSPRERVFNTMLGCISEFIAKRDSTNQTLLSERFLQAAVKLDLSPECGKKLVSWAKSPSTMPSITGNDQEFHKIINTAFVWMCEKFGPVDADRILLHAVQRAEQLPEAFDCPPRSFL